MAGTLTISTLSDGTNSTSATNCIQGSAKAWVNFNGTGTVAIRASYNVSSITDNGTGDYTVNFTNALTDANYSTVISASAIYASATTVGAAQINSSTTTEVAPTTTAMTFSMINASNSNFFDVKYLNVAVFR
jgi:hypothetical protein